jgi:hypothetical protein
VFFVNKRSHGGFGNWVVCLFFIAVYEARTRFFSARF